MAKQDTTETAAPELTAEERAEKIRNTPRQSQKRFVELYAILRDAAPERVSEYFGDQVDVLEANVSKLSTNPVQAAIDKAVEGQVALAIKNLENTDALNGYANFQFDQSAFDEKTKERKPRVTKSKAEKVTDIISGDLSDEEKLALAEALKAAGISL